MMAVSFCISRRRTFEQGMDLAQVDIERSPPLWTPDSNCIFPHLHAALPFTIVSYPADLGEPSSRLVVDALRNVITCDSKCQMYP